MFFLEKNPKCVKILEENIQLLGINDKGKLDSEIEVIQQDCFAGIKSLATRKSRFSIAFVDPPYDRGMAKKALKTLDPYDILQPNCILAIQHDKKETLPERQGRFLLFRQKILGSTVLSFYHDESHSE